VAGAETFTYLTILEARDRASEIVHRVDSALDRFLGTANRAADEAQAAGERIDEGLLKTASGADALDLAAARVTAAETKMTAATKEQADAETALLQAREAAASEDELAAAADRVGAAETRAAAAARELQAAQDRQVATARAASAAQDTEAAATERAGAAAATSGGHFSGLTKIAALTTAGMAYAGYKMVKAAGDFQNSTQHLVTDAGESQSQLGRVQAGMLAISTATGTSAEAISNGMYHIESSIPPMANAAQRANIALDDLKVAAEGAKVGGADLDTVAKTLTGTLNSYSDRGYTATQMMNALITTVGQGDMRMQDLATSLGGVAPAAAKAGISFNDLGAAIATMTAQNMTAHRATMELNHTIGALENPTSKQADEMQAMGLSAIDLSQNLGKRGLSGTIDMISTAILQHMGKSGLVLEEALTKSQQAAKEANAALGQMPSNMRKLAEAWAKGSLSTKDFDKAISGLAPAQQTMYKQFESLTKQSGSFSAAVHGNSKAAETYNAALSKIMGGTVGLNTALMLSGSQMAGFKSRSQAIGESLHKSGSEVDNWSKIQGTFNQKMAVAKTSVQNAGIALGSALLPAVSQVLTAITHVLVPIATWIGKHQHLAGIIFGSIAAIAGFTASVTVARKSILAVKGALGDVATAFKVLGKEGAIGKQIAKIPWGRMASGASSAWDTVRLKAMYAFDGMKSGAGAARDFASDAFDTVRLKGMYAWDAVKSGASTATDAVKDFGGKVAEAAARAGSAAWSGITSGISAVGSGMRTAATAALEFAEKTAMATGAALRAAAAWTIEKAQLIATAVAEKATAAAQWLLNAAMDANPITLIILAVVALVAGFVYLWTHVAGFRDFWIDAWHLIEGAAQAVWGFLSGLFSDMMSIVGSVVGFVRSHWQLLLAILTGPIGIAVGLVIKYWADIKRWFQDGVNFALSVVGWLGRLPGMLWGYFMAMNIKIGQGIEAAVQWFLSLPGKIWSIMTTIYNDMISAGSNIMIGLYNGLVSMASWLGSAVMGLIKDVIPGPILKVLGISSPSKWAHWAGQMVGHGLANGILSTHSTVAAATKQLASAVTGGLSAGMPQLSLAGGGGGLGLAYGGSPGGGGGQLQVTLDMRGAVVASDQSMDQLAQKVGKRLTTVLGPSGGIKWTGY
jgi:hypothetical protein